MKLYKVIWDNQAKLELKDICQYLKEKSPEASEKVRKEIIKTVAGLITMPERFEVFALAGKNYRSILKWRYRIIYEIRENEIWILKIIHTSRSSQEIKIIK